MSSFQLARRRPNRYSLIPAAITVSCLAITAIAPAQDVETSNSAATGIQPASNLGGDRPRMEGASRTTSSGIPLEINHQGVISVNGTRFSGTGLFWFALVDPGTNNNLWTNDGSNLGASNRPLSAVQLLVTDGIFSVRLGDTSVLKMTSIPTSVFLVDNVRLRVWFNDDAGGGTFQLQPDQQLTSSPYAYSAASAAFAPGVVPIGSIIAWHKNLAGTPSLPAEWIECTNPTGTATVNVPGSPLNGQLIPDLNTTPPGYEGGRFLRGAIASGALQADEIKSHKHPAPYSGFMCWDDQGGVHYTGGVATLWRTVSETLPTGGAETRPLNMSVVWILRVK